MSVHLPSCCLVNRAASQKAKPGLAEHARKQPALVLRKMIRSVSDLVHTSRALLASAPLAGLAITPTMPPQGPSATSAHSGTNTSTAVQPAWFDSSRFSSPGFEADGYIAELRRFVPTDELRTALDAHAAELKAELEVRAAIALLQGTLRQSLLLARFLAPL